MSDMGISEGSSHIRRTKEDYEASGLGGKGARDSRGRQSQKTRLASLERARRELSTDASLVF